MNLTIGDIFEIKTETGNGFLQYVDRTSLGVELVRVLDIVNGDLNQEGVNRPERWNTEFPLKAALTKKIVTKVGNFDIPANYKIPKYARTPHSIHGEFKGWFIIDRNTLQRKLKLQLTSDDLKLSPFGVMNDTLIREYLESDWRLEKWK